MTDQIKDRNHYVPASYLENFTDSRGVLHVVHLRTGRKGESDPEALGVKRGLYRPASADEHPNVFEDAFMEFEGAAAPVLKNILANRCLPTNDDELGILFNFIAFQLVRTPAARENIERPLQHSRRMIIDLVLASKKRFESTAKKAGIDPAEVTYEQAKVAFEKGMEFPVHTEEYLHYAMVKMNAVLELLPERQWSVLYSDRPGEQFITSDHPASLVWSNGRQPNFYGPGHAHLETDLTFPVGSGVALLGQYERPAVELEANRATVAALNARAVAFARTFLASAAPDFVVMKESDVILDAAGFLATVQENLGRPPRN